MNENNMFDHINRNNAVRKAADADKEREQAAAGEKTRRERKSRYIVKSAATLLTIIAVCAASVADLLSVFIAFPATVLCTVYFGYCLGAAQTFHKGSESR